MEGYASWPLPVMDSGYANAFPGNRRMPRLPME